MTTQSFHLTACQFAQGSAEWSSMPPTQTPMSLRERAEQWHNGREWCRRRIKCGAQRNHKRRGFQCLALRDHVLMTLSAITRVYWNKPIICRGDLRPWSHSILFEQYSLDWAFHRLSLSSQYRIARLLCLIPLDTITARIHSSPPHTACTPRAPSPNDS